MKQIIQIDADDLTDGGVICLLQAHRQEMLKHSPPQSVHALDAAAIMQQPNLTFFSARANGIVVACGALSELDSAHAEIKSMKVANGHIGQGLGRAVLMHLLDQARKQFYTRLSLETGSAPAFIPARSLYESVGFTKCLPFGDYVGDENSVCMTVLISA